MLDASLFVSQTIHEREITLSDGKKHRIHFRQCLSADLEKVQTASTDPVEHRRAVTRVLVQSVVDPDGKPGLTTEMAETLLPGVRLAMMAAVAQVNEFGAHVGKVLPPETSDPGSGTS